MKYAEALSLEQPTPIVVNAESLCPWCSGKLSDETLRKRLEVIAARGTQHMSTFICGTRWFMPDSAGLEMFSRRCGPPDTQAFYGPTTKRIGPPTA